jgi:hypothetical protein
MTLRKGHGNGKGAPRIEVLPPDELPSPVPADDEPLTGVDRRHDGTVTAGAAARALGARGGRVKAKRVRLARSLGLSAHLGDAEAFAPYRGAASAFRRHHTAELAKLAGGECGAAPSSMVASAALQLGASRFLFDQGTVTGDPATLKTASQLADASRQNLLAAYEMATREAEARAKARGPVDPLAAFRTPPKALP